MSLIRVNPFQEIDTLQREMNRLFDRLSRYPEPENVAVNFVPSAEIQETPTTIYLNVELPGINPQDLDVQATAESVTISGERKSQFTAEEQGKVRSEFRYGQFQRVIPLPTRIQNTKVEAEYKNGVLKLTLPKAEAEQHKVVKVNLS